MGDSKDDSTDLVCGDESPPSDVMICDFNMDDWVDENGNPKLWEISSEEQF